MGGGGECHPTIFRVLSLSNASIWSGSLIVVLRQGQGPNAWTRRWLAARSFWFLQAAVIVAVLRGILQVLHRVGGGEGHSPMGVLKNSKTRNEYLQHEGSLFAQQFSFFLMVLCRYPAGCTATVTAQNSTINGYCINFSDLIRFTLQKSENRIKY